MNSTDIKINIVNKIFYEIYCVFVIQCFLRSSFHNSVLFSESKTIHINQSRSKKSESLTELKITFVIKQMHQELRFYMRL